MFNLSCLFKVGSRTLIQTAGAAHARWEAVFDRQLALFFHLPSPPPAATIWWASNNYGDDDELGPHDNKRQPHKYSSSWSNESDVSCSSCSCGSWLWYYTREYSYTCIPRHINLDSMKFHCTIFPFTIYTLQWKYYIPGCDVHETYKCDQHYLYYYKVILILVVMISNFDLPNNYLFVPSKTNHNKDDGVCIFLWGNIKFVLQERWSNMIMARLYKKIFGMVRENYAVSCFDEGSNQPQIMIIRSSRYFEEG